MRISLCLSIQSFLYPWQFLGAAAAALPHYCTTSYHLPPLLLSTLPIDRAPTALLITPLSQPTLPVDLLYCCLVMPIR